VVTPLMTSDDKGRGKLRVDVITTNLDKLYYILKLYLIIIY
jgi:hypothetical protein